MDTFDDYTQGHGEIKSPNPQARQIIVEKMKTQGLRQVHSLPLSSMTFRLFEQIDAEHSPLNPKYRIEYKGR